MVNIIFLAPLQCKECSSCWVNQWPIGTQLDRAKGNLSLINIWDFVPKEQLESISPGHDFLSSPKILPSHPVFPTLINGASPHEMFFPYLFFWGGANSYSYFETFLKYSLCWKSVPAAALRTTNGFLFCVHINTAHSIVPSKSNHLKTFWLISKWINRWSARIQTTEVCQYTAIRKLVRIRFHTKRPEGGEWGTLQLHGAFVIPSTTLRLFGLSPINNFLQNCVPERYINTNITI